MMAKLDDGGDAEGPDERFFVDALDPFDPEIATRHAG
jgi:hypothetical protein